MNAGQLILVVEDNPGDARLIKEMLAEQPQHRIDVSIAETLQTALATLKSRRVDVVLLDLSLPDSFGMETFAAVYSQSPQVPIIVLSGTDDETVALSAVKGGAQDYLIKGQVEAQLLTRSIAYAIERKQAEQALRDSESKYKTLYEGAADAILIVQDQQIVDCNSRAAAMFNCGMPDILSRSVCDLSAQRSKKDFSRLAERFGAALEGQIQDFEWEYLRHDGSSFFAEVYLDRVKLGNAWYVQAIIRDVTERLKAEAALKESEERYRSVVSALEEGVILVDADGMILTWNGAAERLLKLSTFDLEGKPYQVESSLLFYEDGTVLAPSEYPVAVTLRTGKPCSNVTVGTLTSAGEPLWLSVNTQPLKRSGETRPYAVVVSFADVTARKRTADELREERDFTAAILDGAGALVLVLNRELRIIRFNRACEMLTGYRAAEVMGRSVLDFLIAKSDVERTREHLARLWAGESTVDMEVCINTKQGEARHIAWSGSVLRDAKGAAKFIVSAGIDMTEQMRATEAMRLTTKVFESSTEGILVTDASARVLQANPAFTLITGHEVEHIVNKVPPMLDRGNQELWLALNEHGVWQGENWDRRKDGDRYPQWLTVSAVRNERNEVTNYVVVFSDITTRKQAEDRLNYLANHDPLTGLANRALFMERLQQALAHAHRNTQVVALIFMDLDRFKIINDTLGHAIGDKLLQTVGKRIRSCARAEDTIARFGGDEFTILLEDIGEELDVTGFVQKVLNAFSTPLMLEGHEIFVTPSVGISLYPNDGVDAQSLLKNADAAMYRAKDLGRNNYQFFTADMNSRASTRLAIENSLRKALERKEFRLYYQPQVNIETGRITSMEALLRWQHPEFGLFQPAQFIPIAEETGLIIPIGEWVLRTACAQTKLWHREQLPLRVAVNLSGRQILQSDLLAMVKNVLEETGLDPTFLELEITESVAMEYAEETIAMLRELKDMGIRIAIDDFGTGYSSLSHLKRFPIDTIKIDRSFVRDITTGEDDANITGAMIAMAHSLKLEAIAEGVESAAQLEFLQAHACGSAQGFFFNHPLPADKLAQVLRNQLHMDTLLADASQERITAKK